MGNVTFKAGSKSFTLYEDRVLHAGEFHPLQGVVARVEAGSALQQRVTAARLIGMGVFAFAAQKKSGGEVYLTIEGPAFFWTAEVDRKQRDHAMKFAARVNDAARKSAMRPPQPVPPPRLAPAPASPPPGWYPDRQNPSVRRWWDGQRWTSHTQGH